MLSPQSMSVDRFFDRDDPEKQFLLSVIRSCADPDAVMANYRAGLARVNSPAHYAAYAESGFFHPRAGKTAPTPARRPAPRSPDTSA